MHSEDIIVIDEVIKINEGNNPLDKNSTPLRSRNITGCLIFDINKILQQKVLSPSPDYSFEKSAKSILKIDEKFKNKYKLYNKKKGDGCREKKSNKIRKKSKNKNKKTKP